MNSVGVCLYIRRTTRLSSSVGVSASGLCWRASVSGLKLSHCLQISPCSCAYLFYSLLFERVSSTNLYFTVYFTVIILDTPLY